MASAKKFLFEVSFDKPSSFVDDDAPPPPPTFTEEEREAARAEGYAVGREVARAEAEASIARLTADTLDTLGGRLAELLNAQSHRLDKIERQATATAIDALKKIVPTIAKHQAIDEIAALFGRCVGDALEEPRLVLRVAESVFEETRERVTKLAGSLGFAGKIVILAEDGMAEGDCRLEWADGGAERDTARLWADIDKAVVRALSTTNTTQPH